MRGLGIPSSVLFLTIMKQGIEGEGRLDYSRTLVMKTIKL